MNKLFSTLLSSLRAKFTSLVTKLRMLTSPAFLQAQVFTRIRQWFVKLFDVRPRDKKDYYSIFRWMVSKRLAFSVVVVLGVLCLWYITSMLPAHTAGAGGTTVRTYKYNAIPLKFYSGSVRILAADGHLAYVGQVEDAQCAGNGILYDRDGNMVYEGEFADSMYNGSGTTYYPDGTVEYTGAFTDNLYNGQGSYYRSTGILEYVGEHVMGARSGQGTLYNSAGNPIFTGTFQKNEIVYSEFLEKDTSAVAQMYTGRSVIYSTDSEYCVSMPEINAVYSVADGANALEEGWTVDGVFVLSDTFPAEGDSYTSINQITAAFGQPDYFGTTWVNLSEAVAANLLADEDEELLGRVTMSLSASFDDVYTVNSYDEDFQLYIYTYERSGLLYTFYCTGSGMDSFVMYAIELA